MIIVLKGADFSGNNIGQVELPLVWDEDALSYVQSLSGHAGFSDQQNRALNNLFKGLKNNNIWEDIHGLYFPIFGRVDGGKNVKNTSTIELPTANATYDSKGVLFSLGWQFPTQINRSNFHLGIYNTTPTLVSGGSPSISAGVTATSNIIGRKVALSNTEAGYVINATIRPTVLNHANNTGLLIGASSQSLDKTSFFADSEQADDAVFGGTATTTHFNIGGAVNGENTALLQASIGAIIHGVYIPSDKMGIIATLLDDVIERFS